MMQQLLRLPRPVSTFVYHLRALNHDSNHTFKNGLMGLPFSFDEPKARDYFDRWRKSLWLAPSDWRQTPVTITRRFLPTWSFSLKGSVVAQAYVKRGSWLWGGAEWHPLVDSVSVPNIDLPDINVYAAHTLDRQHIIDINLKTDGGSVQPLDVSSTDESLVEQWTIDRETAFEIGWDMDIVNRIQNHCITDLNKKQSGVYRITSISFSIQEQNQDLLYYPVYLVNYQYRGREMKYFINGRTGQVAGSRQFSRLKVSYLALGIVYPALLLSVIPILSSAFHLIVQRSFFVPITLLSVGLTLPFAIGIALQLGRYARDYPRFYRWKRDIREWLDYKKENKSSRSSHFAYGNFNTTHFDQSQLPPGFDRQRTYETRKPTLDIRPGPDLYGLLGVIRVASDAEIKQAYLIKAKEFHPDRNVDDKQAEEKFKLINQAYAILSDPEQRQIFDEFGFDNVKYK